MRSQKTLSQGLKRRVMIQQLQLVADGAGGYSDVWVEFALAWAEVRTRQQREQLSQEQLNQANITIFKIRYIEGLSPRMRVVMDNRVFEIDSIIDPNESKTYLQIYTKERS